MDGAREEAPEVVPGRSFGPIRIGMTAAEVVALRGGYPVEGERVGPYRLMVDIFGTVVAVSAPLRDLPTGVRWHGRWLPPTLAALAELPPGLGPDCSAPHDREGFLIVECDHGGAYVTQRRAPGASLVIQVARVAATQVEDHPAGHR